MRTLIALLLTLALTTVAPAHAADATDRVVTSLSDSPWEFVAVDPAGSPSTPPPDSKWDAVTLPHCYWSRVKPNTEILLGWYRRDITLPMKTKGRRYYLVFDGVGTVADVSVNGKAIGHHAGAYTRFILDATDALKPGEKNTLLVRVDNTPESMKDCLPDGSRLYKVWGGIYRSVSLLSTDAVHIDPTDFGSDGVYVTPTNVTESGADLKTNVLLRNMSDTGQSMEVHRTLLDSDDKTVFTDSATAKVAAMGQGSITLDKHVENPRLWSPATPALYHVKVEVSCGGKVVDSVVEPTGFRTITFKDNLVTLNGKPIVLAGANLHQEIESKAAAMSPQDFFDNFLLIKDLGFNWMRLPHYPHARLEYDQCDRLGLLCWAENGHTNKTDAMSDNTFTLTTEMVKQNWNHPSIAVWSMGNESGGVLADAFSDMVKALDPSRPTAVANMEGKKVDFHGDNTYGGWYGKGSVWDFKPARYVTETGAGGVLTTHCDYAVASHLTNKYEPEEYQQLFAEARMQLGFRTGHASMFTWWTMRDFNDRKYKNAWNTKGLITYSGDKKDVYYLFRCFLNPDERTVHITSKRYFIRTGSVTNGIKVYSNAPSLTLTLNGQKISTLEKGKYTQPDGHPVDNVFYWPVPLRTGKNQVTVDDDAGHGDSAVIYFYGTGGEPEASTKNLLVQNLTTDNPANHAFYMDMPVQKEWPIYWDLDSTADNSIVDVPEVMQGATWIATRRPTKAGQETGLSFTVTRPTKLMVMCSDAQAPAGFLADAGFKRVESPRLLWRDNDLYLVPAVLYERDAAAGESIHIGKPDRDYVVTLMENRK